MKSEHRFKDLLNRTVMYHAILISIYQDLDQTTYTMRLISMPSHVFLLIGVPRPLWAKWRPLVYFEYLDVFLDFQPNSVARNRSIMTTVGTVHNNPTYNGDHPNDAIIATESWDVITCQAMTLLPDHWHTITDPIDWTFIRIHRPTYHPNSSLVRTHWQIYSAVCGRKNYVDLTKSTIVLMNGLSWCDSRYKRQSSVCNKWTEGRDIGSLKELFLCISVIGRYSC